MRLAALHRAAVLAAVLLVGSVAAPLVHKVEHGRHAAEAQAAAHAAHGHVHAPEGVDAFSVALPAAVQHDVLCVLCSTWPTPALLPVGTLVPARHVFGLLADPAAVRTLSGALARSIRGPPARF